MRVPNKQMGESIPKYILNYGFTDLNTIKEGVRRVPNKKMGESIPKLRQVSIP